MLAVTIPEPVLYLAAVGAVLALVPLVMRTGSNAAATIQRGAQLVGILMLVVSSYLYWSANRTADWQYQALPDRRCSVEFPLSPSTYSQRGTGGIQFESLRLAGFQGDTLYMAGSTELPDNANSANTDQLMDAIRKSIEMTPGPDGDPTRVTSQYQVTRNGTYGHGFNATSGEFLITVHYYRIGKRLYEIQASRHESTTKDIAERFLASPKFGKVN